MSSLVGYEALVTDLLPCQLLVLLKWSGRHLAFLLGTLSLLVVNFNVAGVVFTERGLVWVFVVTERRLRFVLKACCPIQIWALAFRILPHTLTDTHSMFFFLLICIESESFVHLVNQCLGD